MWQLVSSGVNEWLMPSSELGDRGVFTCFGWQGPCHEYWVRDSLIHEGGLQHELQDMASFGGTKHGPY